MLSSVALLASWVPNPHPDFRTSPTPYITLMAIGFVIGVGGHVYKTRWVVALGIGLMFLAMFLFPLLTNLLHTA
ncbi:MAG TPA: hypothetical protein VGN69_05765 [Solirubrobacteraceae bacterium]|jgi:hypothetical protein|nr:hypothetical protein [Solirubrobacteraceae bacterium]